MLKVHGKYTAGHSNFTVVVDNFKKLGLKHFIEKLVLLGLMSVSAIFFPRLSDKAYFLSPVNFSILNYSLAFSFNI